MIKILCFVLSVAVPCYGYLFRKPDGRWWNTWSYSVIKEIDTREGPYPLNSNYESYMEHLLTLHVRNMTLEIIKDVESRMVLVAKVANVHEGTKNYDIGFVTSGMRDKFKFMVQLYHEYAETTNFLGTRFDVNQYFQANFVLQGLYKEILMERELYYEIIAYHKSRRRTRSRKPKLGEYTTPRNGRRRGKKKIGKSFLPNDEAYKKALRVQNWAKTWNNFDPAREGIAVDFEDMI